MQMIFPFAAQIRKLDLLYATLGREDHCTLIQNCPNLEVIEARNRIGDRGLEVLARYCKQLRRLRIDQDADVEEEDGISERGLIALARGCPRLEYLAVHVSNISVGPLQEIGAHLENLCDLRIFLIEDRIMFFSLDDGVRELLRGCKKLQRFALCLTRGGLTDNGLMYLGQYSQNVRRMLLGNVGGADKGLQSFSGGSRRLQELEVRGCNFSEHAIADAARRLKSLRYLWVSDYRAPHTGDNLLAMARPFWNVELIPTRRLQETDEDRERLVNVVCPTQVLVYFSLAGQRIDFPRSVRLISQHPRG